MQELKTEEIDAVSGGSITEVVTGVGLGAVASGAAGVIGKIAFGAAFANPISLGIGAIVGIGYGLSRMGREKQSSWNALINID